MTPIAVALANLIVLGCIAHAAILQTWFPDLYYLSVQEDEYLEWATFWAFALAALAYARIVPIALAHGTDSPRPRVLRLWFPIGVALFCAFVAMEEVSWGQRLIGYRPAEYFLRENFQQEPNIHNVFETGVRKLALQAVIAGYGLLLPALAAVPRISGVARAIGVSAPPIGLIPAFAATLVVYVVYPWDYTGEVVELMLGFGFLFAALDLVAVTRRGKAPFFADEAGRSPIRSDAALSARAVLSTAAVVAALGVATAAAARTRGGGDEGTLHRAQAELAALRQDFLAAARAGEGRYATRCNLHKRVYTYAKKYRAKFLASGEWTALVSQGLPEQRAEYFIDPWNVPYWIRDHCDGRTRERAIFVYSFGPNRRRESTEQQIGGDDVGVYIKR
ncbi:MAG TPA: hypothetical protein VIV14_02820 [Gammaproteobacteria bacterium]